MSGQCGHYFSKIKKCICHTYKKYIIMLKEKKTFKIYLNKGCTGLQRGFPSYFKTSRCSNSDIYEEHLKQQIQYLLLCGLDGAFRNAPFPSASQ